MHASKDSMWRGILKILQNGRELNATQDCRLPGLFCIIMYDEDEHDRWDWFLNADRHRVLGHMVVARLQESLDLIECDKEWQVLFILNLKLRFGRMPRVKIWDLEVKTFTYRLTALILKFTHSSDTSWQIESTIETNQAFLRK